MTVTHPPRHDETAPAPYLWAAGAGLAVFVLYLLTLSPTTAFWDTSEYIAAAKVLGIPHPPGNPLFTIMAHAFGLLPIAEHYAVRINVFAALTSAAASGFWFLVAERWLRALVPDRTVRLAASFGGILVGATAWTVWNQSVVNEKVYTVSLLSIALVTWLALLWGDMAPGPRRDRIIVLVAYLLALTSTNHMMGVLAAPAVALYVLWTDWRVVTRPAVIAGVVGAVVVGLSINYVFLPMRAGQYPPINEGEPIGYFSDDLMAVLNREQYGKPSVLLRQADPVAQVANYLQYWGWQWAYDWPPLLRSVATAVITFVGLYGLVRLVLRDSRAGWTAAALLATLTAALVFYLNFKYGYSQYPDRPQLAREVRERDYFFMASFQMFGVLVALGLGGLVQAIASALRERGVGAARWAAATPVLAIALVPLAGNHVTASRAGERLARDFAVDMLESVEPYGILITAGDNDTFPLWYAQEVEGVRRDVTLANLSLMNTRWHLRQLRRRQTPEFELDRSVALWGRDAPAGEGGASTAVAAARPTTPVFSLTEAQLDSLPEVMPLPSSGTRIGDIEIAFGQEYLVLQDITTLFLIRDNLGKRPIYFAWSTGGYADQTFGLTSYLVSQGLVRRLEPRQVVESDSVRLVPGLGYLDVPRTRRLLWEVYHWRSAARERPRGWVDAPSSSILTLYQIVYSAGADALRRVGLPQEAARADSIADAVQANIGRE